MRKHKILLTLISVLVLTAVVVTASAIAGGRKPDISAGKTENLIADRIFYSLENTEFTIKKTSEEAENCTLTMFLEVKKTQGDFYGRINSFTLSGIAFDSIVFTDLTGKEEAKAPDSLVLTATDGEPDIFRWQVDVNSSILGKGTYTAKAELSYTTGTSEAAAMTKTAEIPVTITVE
ncbi:MAG: hypothetical protein J6A97_05575 [Clostridia bacterium]|nr:hypothetical protein [Clostridia bacterium]